MKALYNDVINKTLSEIDIEPSKKAYCKVLGCLVCRMDTRSILGKKFGLVQDAKEISISIISGNNIYNNPELLGNFILLGLTKDRLRGLNDKEIEFFMHSFCRWPDGRYVLNDID